MLHADFPKEIIPSIPSLPSLSNHPPHFPAVPSAESHLPITQPDSTSFEDLLKVSQLPPPGPSYYAARRALWLNPPFRPPPHILEPSTSRQRLQQLLNSPNAVNDDYIWKNGIEKVWKGLAAGGRLKRRLPMDIVIKIIHCAWLRDDTWPLGAVAPEPDDVLEDASVDSLPMCPPPATVPSLVLPPWMANPTPDTSEKESASGLVVASH